MIQSLSYFIAVLISQAFTSKVSFDYNAIANRRNIGMVCSVQGQEEGSLVKIQHGDTEKITMTYGCVIKSSDTRLSISCIQTGDDVMLTVSLTWPHSSDLGTWNCSYGKSYDTVTFADFISNEYYLSESQTTFNCIVHQECNLFVWMYFFSPGTYLKTIDGKVLLKQVEQEIIIDNEWSRRIIINDRKNSRYLNFTLLDVDISDAGIYYIITDTFWMESAAFIIKITDYPTQPVVLLRSQEADSQLGPYELYCSSESNTQPMFTRKHLSFTWRLSGHNLTELRPCFRLSGPILTLCMDACALGNNDNLSIFCTAHEDGLQSIESQPFIVSASRVTTAVSSRHKDNIDHRAERTTWILVGACLGSFIIGVSFSSLLKLLAKKRGAVCQKEHSEEERSTDVPNDTLYVNTFMTIHARPEGEVQCPDKMPKKIPMKMSNVLNAQT